MGQLNASRTRGKRAKDPLRDPVEGLKGESPHHQREHGGSVGFAWREGVRGGHDRLGERWVRTLAATICAHPLLLVLRIGWAL